MNVGSNISTPGQSAQRIGVRIDQRGENARIAYVTIENQRKLNTLNSSLMQEFVSGR